MLEPWTVLGHLASRNRFARVRLGVGVTDASRRNPAVTAQAAATLHLITRGRAILGIGVGEREGNEPDGVGWTNPVARFEEAIATIRALWNSDGELVTRTRPTFRCAMRCSTYRPPAGSGPSMDRLARAAHAPRHRPLRRRLVSRSHSAAERLRTKLGGGANSSVRRRSRLQRRHPLHHQIGVVDCIHRENPSNAADYNKAVARRNRTAMERVVPRAHSDNAQPHHRLSPDQTQKRAHCANNPRPQRATAPDFPACARPEGTTKLKISYQRCSAPISRHTPTIPLHITAATPCRGREWGTTPKIPRSRKLAGDWPCASSFFTLSSLSCASSRVSNVSRYSRPFSYQTAW